MTDLQAQIDRDQRALVDLKHQVDKLTAGLKIKRGLLLAQKEQELAELGRKTITLPTSGLTPAGRQARRESMQNRINDLQREIVNLKRALDQA